MIKLPIFTFRTSELFNKILVKVCLFPNETGYFTKFKINTEFVGHPAVQNFSIKKDRKALFALLGIPDNEQIIISLLPGSRASEVKKILPILISTVGLLNHKIKKTHFIYSASCFKSRKID